MQPLSARAMRVATVLACLALPSSATAAPLVARFTPTGPAAGFQRVLGLRDPGRPMLRPRRPDGRLTARAAAVARVRTVIVRMVRAGDRIAGRPYVFGGGHGSFASAGYDCSGSVSYVLHAGDLLSTPEDSGTLMGFGDPGPGHHVTIYANAQHALMTIDGRRFDTISFQETGTRWSPTPGSLDGYAVRHPAGL
jgi:hypothetical protein